jgi:hypothetical protein
MSVTERQQNIGSWESVASGQSTMNFRYISLMIVYKDDMLPFYILSSATYF